jgi:branched-chain amino acid transport system substrate-binding protein
MGRLPALAGAIVLLAQAAQAQITDNVVRIGVLNDMSGVFSDFQGPGSVVAAQLAVEDFGGTVAGARIEIVAADHQNRVDTGAGIARQWFDSGVDVIMDVPGSAIALAVHEIARERNRVLIVSGGATSELTGPRCSPNTVHWTLDNWSLANAITRAVVATGGDRWFFLTADYAFGHDLESNGSAFVRAAGGTVVGSVRHPLGTPDFSSFLLRARQARPNILALANAGGDTTNAIKQAAEFGLTAQGIRLAGLVVIINNVHALGLEASQGLLATAPFYWNMNDGTRAFARRFQERHPRRAMPNDMQAGVYAGVLHYLRAVQALGSDGDGRAVVERMKQMETDDPLFGRGRIRADGRKIHPMYLFETQSPAASQGPWDYFRLVRTIPADAAFRPLSEGGCPLAAR